jgi:hypothetical protein
LASLFDDEIYIKSEDNKYRYALGKTSKDRPTVYCFGINPSTATSERLDPTVTRVKNIAQFNGFDGWCMLNIYPQRATDPNDLDAEINKIEHNKNKTVVYDLIQEKDTVWCAWGNLIDKRPYLNYCFLDIFRSLINKQIQFTTIGGVTTARHPKHPLYQKTSKFIKFDMIDYFDFMAGRKSEKG